MKSKAPVFKQSISALVICIVICLFFLQRAGKPKTSFQSVEGIITSIEKINENYPGKDSAKYRYLQIDNYSKPFQLFIGKATGDFKPKFENIDNLKVNDSIIIYFEETGKTKLAPVNNLVFFIDRGKEVIFIEGDSKKNLIYGIIGFCIIFAVILLVLKLKNKII